MSASKSIAIGIVLPIVFVISACQSLWLVLKYNFCRLHRRSTRSGSLVSRSQHTQTSPAAKTPSSSTKEDLQQITSQVKSLQESVIALQSDVSLLKQRTTQEPMSISTPGTHAHEKRVVAN